MLWYVPLTEVWSSVTRINLAIVFAAMFAAVLGLSLRGRRWALLFLPRYQIDTRSANSIVRIGLALNAITPGRLGEVARVVLGAHKFQSGMVFTATTVVSERLLDGVTLLVFFTVASIPEGDPGTSISLMGHTVSSQAITEVMEKVAIGCLFALAFIVILSIPGFRSRFVGLVRRLPWIGPRIETRLESQLDAIGHGLGAFQRPSVIFRAMISSFAIWLAVAIANLTLSYGISGITLSFRQALGLTAVSIAAASIPSAPGSWGTFETGSLLALTMFQVPFERSVGVAFALVSHLCQYIPVVVMGVLAAYREQMSFQELRTLE